MNPKEFSWSEDQQVTVTNPTEQPYIFKVHNKQYELGAHKTAKMPGFIAWVYVYGLSSQMCQADGNFQRWNEEGYRQEYYEKLVKNIDSIMQVVEEEAEPLVNTFEEEDIDESDLPSNTPSATDIANTLAEEDTPPPSEPATSGAKTATVTKKGAKTS